MKIKIDRYGTFVEADTVVIQIGDSDFRISVDNQNNLVINKNGEDSSIHITPSTGNEIKIS